MKSSLLFALLLCVSRSLACSCLEVGKITQDEINKVGEAFIGTIVSISEDESKHQITAIFEVSSYLKGKEKRSQITVITRINGGMCGLRFEKGDKWYIFADYYETELHAGLCGRSVQLTGLSRFAKKNIVGRKNHRQDKRRFRHDKRAIKRFLKSEK